MMDLTGRIVYLFLYPVIALYLRKDERTRVIIRCRDEILLVRHWLGNGHWDLPGGGLHRGENPAKGIQREIREELGIDLSAQLIDKRQYRRGLVRYPAYYFRMEVNEKPSLKLQRFEIAQVQWCKTKDLEHMKVYPQLKQLLREIS